jgi:steroid delta-isomerase-like uncharacterized protein
MAAVAPLDVEAIARDYDAAWNAKDVDAIVARHAADGTYRLHIAGAPTIRGTESMRAAFAASLGNWSDLSFELEQVLFGDGFYVWSSSLHGVLAKPLGLGAVTIPANGVRLTFSGVDVIRLDARGLIESKQTYFDVISAANQAAAS